MNYEGWKKKLVDLGMEALLPERMQGGQRPHPQSAIPAQ